MIKNLFRGTIQIILTVLVTHGFAQAQSPTMTEADAFFKHQDYAEAVTAYTLIVASDSGNSLAWFRLGQSHRRLQQYDEAISAFMHADESATMQVNVRYNLACITALLGNKEESFAWLNKALDSGFAGIRQLETDADLNLLRRDTRFADALRRCDQNARPCEYDDRYRQFDFWLGDWEVYNTVGTRVGTNRIEKAVQGCMLQENWVSVTGITGKSTNYFDPSSGKWIQIWVSQSGGYIYYEGEFMNGGMYFSGEDVARDGKSQLNRMTIEPDENHPANVHQLIETSDDAGVHWSILFDGIYMHPTTSGSQP